jgi:dTDP-4-dehydrorhamnose 3,5-epimerase
MKIIETNLKGCYIIEPEVYKDDRGEFYEMFHKKELEKAIDQRINFVQDNQSISRRGALRGMHFQKGAAAQAKLVQVTKGEVLDVVVDLRPNSPSYASHFKIKLSSENKLGLFIPRGMAHGFLALDENTIFTYKCDNYYNPKMERGIIYNDPNLNIDWNFPISDLIISDKDCELPKLVDLKL